MNIQNLQFFDKDGYNLNFNWNERNKYWEGTIYFPKVSVGLYENATIYILESDGDEFFFPTGNETIKFTWDKLNKFVDEFFMFNFDETYIISETSALIYTPNDGPDCNTLLVNRFDEYEIPLSSTKYLKPLPVHIAFSAKEKYLSSIFKGSYCETFSSISCSSTS